MKAIGIRAENGKIHWAIVEGDAKNPVLVEDGKFNPPESYDLTETAKWIQTRICDIVGRHKPAVCNLRTAETFLVRKPNPKQQAGSLARARFEGMVIASLAINGVEVSIGQIQQMKSRVGSKQVKAYVEEKELRGMDLSKCPKIRCEAVLAAVAALGEFE